MPLTVKLPHFAMSFVGMIDIAAVDAASTRPQIRPIRGSFRVDRLPPVAISTVPTNANATPTASRRPGSRRPRMQTNPSTNSRFRLCSTVAVPEFVQSMANR